MDRELILRYQAVVQPDDDVFHLGDFAFASPERCLRLLDQLPGRKHLLYGNHDAKTIRRHAELQSKFEWCKDYHELSLHGLRLVLMHFPILSWHGFHRGAYMLHGHCHHNMRYPLQGPIIDVGVDGDGYGYAPISFEEVHRRLKNVIAVPLDHHGAKGKPQGDM